MPAACPGQAARRPWTRAVLASSSLQVFFSCQAQAQEPAAHRGGTLPVASGQQSLVVFGNRVVVVRGHLRFQGRELLRSRQRHRAPTVRLGCHTAALALPPHQPAHAPLTHPKAHRHLRLSAFAPLPGRENAFAQIQRIWFCHPSTYGQ